MTESTGENPKSNLWDKCRSSGLSVILVFILVIMIVGLLLPKKVGAGERAKIKAASAQLGAFKTALDLFKVENQHYPTNLNDLIVKPPGAPENWTQHLDKVPSDPWEHPYVYQYPGKHHPDLFDLSSAGPDGKFGTGDDIKNWE